VSTAPVVIWLQALADVQLTPKSEAAPPLTYTVFWAAYAGADTAAIRPAASRPTVAIPDKIKPLRISVPFLGGRRIP
jgi:hypothetical protein